MNLEQSIKKLPNTGSKSFGYREKFISIILTLIYVYSNTPIIANGALLDELDASIELMGENSRTIQRLTEFTKACTNLISSGDISVLSTCDSVAQKFNIEMGKFQKQNELVIEDLIYPYTIPSHAEIVTNVTSLQVIGSNNPADATKHLSIGQEYNDILLKILEECGSQVRQYNEEGIRKCIDITKSLNEKNRTFNTNAGTEINKVLSLDASQVGSSEFNLP
jgi:hypothetical protein